MQVSVTTRWKGEWPGKAGDEWEGTEVAVKEGVDLGWTGDEEWLEGVEEEMGSVLPCEKETEEGW